MVNVYVHALVLGLPQNILDDDEFVERIWAEMPDASISTRNDVSAVTVSQLALSDHHAERRQLRRIRRALNGLGYPRAVVKVEEIAREGWRDDVPVLVGLVRWHWWRLTSQNEGARTRQPRTRQDTG